MAAIRKRIGGLQARAETAQRILAPVDFSELSAHALRYAARLAECSHGRLTALFADPFQPPPYFTEGGLDELKDQLRTAKQQAEAYLREFIATEAPGLQGIEVLVREGLPADTIRTAAQDGRADAIVMGTHGRSWLNRLMLGSVIERVLREATIPVLAVRGDWDDRESAGSSVRRTIRKLRDGRWRPPPAWPSAWAQR